MYLLCLITPVPGISPVAVDVTVILMLDRVFSFIASDNIVLTDCPPTMDLEDPATPPADVRSVVVDVAFAVELIVCFDANGFDADAVDGTEATTILAVTSPVVRGVVVETFATALTEETVQVPEDEGAGLLDGALAAAEMETTDAVIVGEEVAFGVTSWLFLEMELKEDVSR